MFSMKYAARTNVNVVPEALGRFVSAWCVITIGPVPAACCAATDESTTACGTGLLPSAAT
jgi:hypothetical protein